jgi:hypothetical protein
MNEYINIIKTNLTDPQYDVLWEPLPDDIKAMPRKPVLVITPANENNPAAAAQVQKMLDACQLTPAQYNIVTLKEDEMIAWHQLREQMDPKFIFLIGIMPSRLGIASMFRLNEPNRFNERYWLPTLSPEQLNENAELKKQLWSNGMKPLFVDKAYGEIQSNSIGA